jgi:arabinofuranosyltransferase
MTMTDAVTAEKDAARRWPAATALPCLVVATYLVAGWQRRWSSDDAFINYRVVKQVLAGNGPVYNIGERVEVATSTSWLAVLTVADAVSPVSIEWTAVALALAFGAAGVAMGMVGALRLARLRRPDAAGVVVPVGAMTYLGVAGAWDWATGGLENGLGLAWIGGCFLAVTTLVPLDEPSRRRLAATAVLVGSGILVRPDFAALSLGMSVPVLVVAHRRGGWRRVASTTAVALAAPLAVQILRMGYYGQLFPNTLYAKEGASSWWGQGLRYLEDFAGTYALVVPVALVAAWLVVMWRHSPAVGRVADWRLVVASVEVAGVLHLVGILRVGGDYMHARLLLPSWFTLLLPLFAVYGSELRLRATRAATALLLLWAVTAAVALRAPLGSLTSAWAESELAERGIEPPEGDVDGEPGVTDQRAYRIAETGTLHPVGAGPAPRGVDWYADRPVMGWFDPETFRPQDGDGIPVRPDWGRSVVTEGAIGVTGYLAPLDVHVYDSLGLAEPIGARVQLDHRGTPGHEKTLTPAWIAARYIPADVAVDDPGALEPGPEFLPPFHVGVDFFGLSDDTTFASDRAAAAQALDCGELRELADNARAPLTFGRFLGNVVDAVRLNGFRFPLDATAARDQVCDHPS